MRYLRLYQTLAEQTADNGVGEDVIVSILSRAVSNNMVGIAHFGKSVVRTKLIFCAMK